MNEIQMTVRGNVGTEPEQIVFPSGDSMIRFSLASTIRRRGRENGDWQDGPTTWVTVQCRRGLAENVKASLRKGQPVIVQGRVLQSRWEQEGVPRERLVLEADAIGHDLNRGTASYTKVTRAEGHEDEGALASGDPRDDELPAPQDHQPQDHQPQDHQPEDRLPAWSTEEVAAPVPV